TRFPESRLSHHVNLTSAVLIMLTRSWPLVARLLAGFMSKKKHSQRPLRFIAHSSAFGLQDDPHPANLSNPRGSPRALHTPDRTEFYERMEGDWKSGLSGIPSPSRPGSTGKQLHETNGIPLCSVPNGTVLRDYEMAWRRSAEHGTDVKRSKHRQRGPSSPTVQRYASTGSISPAFDITPRSAQIDDEGNIFINGPGHVRKHTDPNWQKAEAALAEATNTENKKEERRNLFLNLKDMTALKTDKAEDMSADSGERDARGGEEKLLGYQMATMERVCAEVKHGEGDAIVTAEMLATLNLDEKKALRKHLLGRLDE
ncbi:unnamed protein product, partial [Alternaria alternata]